MSFTDNGFVEDIRGVAGGIQFIGENNVPLGAITVPAGTYALNFPDFPGLPATVTVLAGSQGNVQSVVDNNDGTSTITLTDSSTHIVDTVEYDNAAANDLPYFVAPPVFTNSSGQTWTSSYEATVIHPVASELEIIPVLYRGGARVEDFAPDNDTDYTLGPDDEFLQVELGVGAFNPATGDVPVVSLETIQEAAVHTPVSTRASTENAKVDMDWSGYVDDQTPAQPVRLKKFALAVWYRPDVVTTDYLWSAANSDGTEGVFQIRLDNNGTMRARTDTTGSIRTPDTAPFSVGDHVCAVWTFEVSDDAQGFSGFARPYISINGGDFVAGTAQAMGENDTLFLSYDTVSFFSNTNGFNGASGSLERLAFYALQDTPATPHTIKSKLVNSQGRSPIHALLDNEYGNPLFAFDGNHTRLDPGPITFDGTFTPANPTRSGNFVSGEPT